MKERDGDSASGKESREAEIGAILVEVIDRWRSGERPAVAEYVERFPHLEGDLKGHFQMLELLENPLSPAVSAPLEEAIAALPEPLQEVFFLRNFRKLSWRDIADQAGRHEEELRREYATALVRLLAEVIPASRAATSSGDV